MQRSEFAPGLSLRGFAPPLSLADFKLIAFDMDSTLINIECVDEIADAAGRKAEVAAITEAAMRGEIADYKESLRQRVTLLEGVPVSALESVYAERLQLNPGAQTLVQACQRAGLKTLLVSGGFTFFTDRIRDRLQLDFTRSNLLGVADGKLTGRLVDQLWGDICDGAEKRRMLLETCALRAGVVRQRVSALRPRHRCGAREQGEQGERQPRDERWLALRRTTVRARFDGTRRHRKERAMVLAPTASARRCAPQGA